jgi:hypothetical protein
MNVTGSSFGHIVTKTNPCRPSAKCQRELEEMFPGHSAIVKMGMRNVSFGNSYSKAINNRLDKKEGVDTKEFVAQERTWAERVNSFLITSKKSGEMYVEYYYLNANKSTYVYKWENGTPLTEEELTKAKTLFKKSSSSKKQSEAGLDEEEQIKVNIVKEENIVSINAFGKTIEA